LIVLTSFFEMHPGYEAWMHFFIGLLPMRNNGKPQIQVSNATELGFITVSLKNSIGDKNPSNFLYSDSFGIPPTP